MKHNIIVKSKLSLWQTQLHILDDIILLCIFYH